MFIVGIYAYRHNWLAGLADSKGKFWSWIAFVLIIFFPVFFLAADGLGRGFYSMLGGLHWQSLVFSIWEQLLCVAMVISLLVWFRNRYNYQGTLALAMSAASYAVYIFHALVIVLLAKSLRGIRIDLALKFLCVAPLAVALCYLVGYLVKKLPLARSIL
jgi:hypothetical protein